MDKINNGTFKWITNAVSLTRESYPDILLKSQFKTPFEWVIFWKISDNEIKGINYSHNFEIELLKFFKRIKNIEDKNTWNVLLELSKFHLDTKIYADIHLNLFNNRIISNYYDGLIKDNESIIYKTLFDMICFNTLDEADLRDVEDNHYGIFSVDQKKSWKEYWLDKDIINNEVNLTKVIKEIKNLLKTHNVLINSNFKIKNNPDSKENIIKTLTKLKTLFNKSFIDELKNFQLKINN